MAARVTSNQKYKIKDLFDQVELDPKTVTLMHKRWGAEDRHIGRQVDEWLDELNVEQASALIGRLIKEVGEDDDD